MVNCSAVLGGAFTVSRSCVRAARSPLSAHRSPLSAIRSRLEGPPSRAWRMQLATCAAQGLDKHALRRRASLPRSWLNNNDLSGALPASLASLTELRYMCELHAILNPRPDCKTRGPSPNPLPVSQPAASRSDRERVGLAPDARLRSPR